MTEKQDKARKKNRTKRRVKKENGKDGWREKCI
jgi:hypothetical protein